MSRFLAELRRRNVIRVAGLYLAGAWLLAQVAGTVLPMFAAPAWLARSIVIALMIGFVPALVFTWAFEWTPKGLVREDAVPEGQSIAPQTGKRLDRWIMVVLALALGYFAFDKFVLSPGREAAQMQVARQEGRTEAIVAKYGERSIAVLPFADMSQNKNQQYLSDGIAEELLNLLATVPQLRVISRSSAFSFRGKNLDIPTIARKLNVGHVLEGSVRQAGNRVRVTVKLIDARSDTQLWSDTYDRPLDDIFAIQDEIAAGVVAQLKIRLLGKTPTVTRTDSEAYTLYLQAMAIPHQTAEDFEKSIGMLKRVLAIDPTYVRAWDGLAGAYGGQASFGLIPAEEGYRLSREAANKALAIDPHDSQAHAQLADIALRRDGDLAAAARHMQRALRFESRDLNNNLNIAEDILKSLGRLDDAVAVNEYIVTLDPMQSIAYSQSGIAYQQAGQLDKSIASSRIALDMEPGQPVTHFIIGSSLLLKGDAKAALVEMQEEPFEPFRLFGLAMAYHSLGEQAKSDAVLAEIIEKYEKDAAYNIAYVEAWRGNIDEAFAWLDKAVEYKDSALPMVAIEPLFANLHDDPRWLAFLRSQDKAPEQLAKIEFKVTLPQEQAAATTR